ncbi:MAG: ATP-binding protein [Terriglobia bacterium]
MIELSDKDILRRLTDTEDSTVERKTASDYRDCLKTAVAFSNSLPVDDPAIIFVGVGNDGTVQENSNLESLEKKVSEEIKKIYPPILPQMKVMRDNDGREFLVVIVRGSENRPHFGGPSFVRDGTQTREASAQQFERLIAERNSKTREILKWRDKKITLYWPPDTSARPVIISSSRGRSERTVIDCDQFHVTLEKEMQVVHPSQTYGRVRESFPLAELEIGFDHSANRLELRMKYRA